MLGDSGSHYGLDELIMGLLQVRLRLELKCVP